MVMSSRIVVINNRWAFLAGSSMATGVAVFVVVVLLSLVVLLLLQKKENKFKEVSIYCLGLLKSCDLREGNKKGMK